MGKREYAPPLFFAEGQRGESVELDVMEKRYRRMVAEFLNTTVHDTRIRPDLLPDLVIDKKGKEKGNQWKKICILNKEIATWFAFESKGIGGLAWWCDLVGISYLRFRRGINEILEGQESNEETNT